MANSSNDVFDNSDPQMIGDLVRDGKFQEALQWLERGGCQSFSEQDWIDQDLARSRTPITLICDQQYQGARAGRNPLENELIGALIESGCPLDAVDDYGNTALNYAAGGLDAQKVALLLLAGAHPDSPGAEFPPLISVLMNGKAGSSAIAWRLLESGASVNDPSVDYSDDVRMCVSEWVERLAAEGTPVDSSSLTAFEELKELRSQQHNVEAISAPSPRL